MELILLIIILILLATNLIVVLLKNNRKQTERIESLLRQEIRKTEKKWLGICVNFAQN